MNRIMVIALLVTISLSGCIFINEPSKPKSYLGSKVYSKTSDVDPLDRFTSDNSKPELFTPSPPISGNLGKSKLLFDNSERVDLVCSTPTNFVITTDKGVYTIDKNDPQLKKDDNAKYGVYTKDNTKCFGADKDTYLTCWDTQSWKSLWKSDLKIDNVFPFKKDLVAFGSNFIAIVDSLTGKMLWSDYTTQDKFRLNGIYGNYLVISFTHFTIEERVFLLDSKNLKLHNFVGDVEDACFLNNELWVCTADHSLLKVNPDTGEVTKQVESLDSRSVDSRFTVFNNKLVDFETLGKTATFDPNDPEKKTVINGKFGYSNPLLDTIFIINDDEYRFESSTVTGTKQIDDFLLFVDGLFLVGYRKDGLYLFAIVQ